MPRARYIPDRYKGIWLKIHREGIVGTYQLARESETTTKAEAAALVAQWPPANIKALPGKCGVTVTRCAALLGINKKTFEYLRAGRYKPSAALCRRMALLVQHAVDGMLFPSIVPQRAEMRRRLILFRAWWFGQAPRRDLPEVTFTVRVNWGRNKVQTLDVPVTLLPRMKLVKWSGLAELVKELTIAARKVAHANGRVAWSLAEAEFWDRYAKNTLPAKIEERCAKQAAAAGRPKKRS